jgi:ATP-binding cassette, subfamily B, bacterial
MWAGGGGMMGGGMWGGQNRGGNASEHGLPFGGIPYELQAGVDKLLKEEPPSDKPDLRFSQRASKSEKRRLSLWGLLKQYPRRLALAVGLVVVVSFCQQAGPKFTEVAVNQGMAVNDFTVVAIMAVAYLFTTITTAVSQRMLVSTSGRLAAWGMNDLRVRVFTQLQRLSMDYFTDEKAGVVMTRMTSDIENLQQLMQDGLSQFAIQFLTMIVIAVLLFTMNVKLAFITVLIITPTLTAMSLWFRKASTRGYDRVRDGIANVLADLSESLHGVRVVVAHNRQRHNVVAHRNVVGEYRDANNYTAHVNAMYGPSTQMLGMLGQALLLAIGGNMVAHGSLSIGALIAFFLYLNRFFQPIQLLVQQYNLYQQGQSSIYKLRTLLEAEPSVNEAADAYELPQITGEITFDDVSFGYNPAVPVIQDVSLTITPGETVAFVGPTGAGKSTMAKLVTRFYDPTGGRVLIDGNDLRKVTLRSLRDQLGVVPQEPFLFAGSIRDNIAFSRPEATDEEVDQAVQTVGLTELIERLPDGLDTFVHERGQSLASGERQLIALARAFLAQPRVLVLDEATSNLDLQSETKVESALDRLLEGRTAILIAHRLTTAMKADRIVVINDGRVVEIGSHDELVAAQGMYAGMYETWARQGGSVDSAASAALPPAPAR